MIKSEHLDHVFDDIAEAMTAAMEDETEAVDQFCVEWALELRSSTRPGADHLHRSG